MFPMFFPVSYLQKGFALRIAYSGAVRPFLTVFRDKG
ncbi:MAG TPA: hypothetical protein DEB17_06820 [Chlorobaculum sp.]|uniref:Uncharacterized protein n=1 Tax=Chlorobaculum tepidum (strain ATCC 49652 / DSM 12025 / NBRC 103806 / TLS) TaxID=194439 RepID=Q8KFW0_CHLTE|nr:hypothetical protein CT0210 [Chlorobaculum tepidum TLS]HBU23686.1 hypothetical protein [Chlorobaculum sp.]